MSAEKQPIKISDPRLLPTSIKMDIETLMEYTDIPIKEIMGMVRGRLKSDVEIDFSPKDLQGFIDEVKEKKKSKLPVPYVNAELSMSGESMVNKIDKSPSAEFKNNSALLEHIKKEAIERMQLMKKTQVDRKEIIIELEAISMKYMDIMVNLIDKQEKLQLNFQESNQYKKQIKEDVSKLFIIIKSVLKQNVSVEKYKKIIEDLKEVMKLYKF